MLDFLPQVSEATIRMVIFFGVFTLLAGLELLAPRRKATAPKGWRWLGNWGLVILDTALLRMVFPMAAVGMAAYTDANNWGLLNAFELPYALQFAIALLVLDFAIWLQHVIFHAVPLLWRFHMVHHADLDLDVSSGFRFHPGEILLSMGYKFAVIAALGPPAAAVLVFEVVLNAMAMFNHSNLNLPQPLDRILRMLVVTPDMHRVHHSIDARETNSNFGFNLSWWDRLFGTYVPQPKLGHDGMTLGLEQHQAPKKQTLWSLLIMPIAGKLGAYPINRRSFD